MSKRRGHGEGSIYQRKDGRWAATVDLGWQDGRRLRKAVYGITRKEVADKLRVLQSQKAAGAVPNDRITLGVHLTEWLEAKEGTVRPGTFVRYEQLVRLHLVPGLGRVRLARLSPRDLQGFYADRLKAGCAPRTVGHMHRVLFSALKQGARWGLVGQNVASLVSPPRAPRMAMETLTATQSAALIEAAEGHRFEALFVLALHTGMRKGELLGLRWSDIDLEAGTLHVQGSLQPVPGRGLSVVEVKTESSRRQVDLGTATSSALRRHRARQAKERLKAGAAWTNTGLVFTNVVGRPVHPSNLHRRDFRPLLEKAGLPQIRFHDLRHTCATLLLGQGVHPKVVSEMLGHSDIGVTLNLYSHVTPTMQKQAVDALDDLLGETLAVNLAVNQVPE